MAMRRVLQAASWLSLLGVVVPPVMFLAGRMELDGAKRWMLIATVAWFVVTPLWMGREKPNEATDASA